MYSKKEYKEAANAYLSFIESVNVMHDNENTMIQEKEESASIQFHNVLLLCILVLIVLGGSVVGVYLYHQWKVRRDIHSSEIEKMKADVEILKIELERTKEMETSNEGKILSLERRIDQLQKDIMERLHLGKVVYDALENGEHLPSGLKGAESYLLDYVMIKRKDLYDQWNVKYTKLTPHMYTFLLLTEMNKTNDEIEEILSITPSSLRSLRSRLASKERH